MINNKVIKIANCLIGDFKIVKDHRNGSNRTGVLEISVGNKRMFIKVHNRLSRWNPEVYAYRNWTCILEEYAPTLIHYFQKDNVYGIIITPVAGKTINEYKVNDEKILETAYFKAGELLKQLHNNFKGTYFGIPSVEGLPLENNAEFNPIDYINNSLENILKAAMIKS